jgi:hypothetical protein
MAFDVLKEESWAGLYGRGRPSSMSELRHAVGDLSDFENGIHLDADFLQLTGALQRRQPIA